MYRLRWCGAMHRRSTRSALLSHRAEIELAPSFEHERPPILQQNHQFAECVRRLNGPPTNARQMLVERGDKIVVHKVAHC
jgi:hypothetical protein